MKLLLILIFVQVNIVQLFAQSAWNQPSQQGYTQIGMSQIGSYDKLFSNEKNEVQLSREIQEQQLQLYVEYGLNEQVTFVFNLPVIRNSISGNGIDDKQTALGNIRFGSRVHLYSSRFELSAQLDVDANTSRLDQGTGLSSGYNAWSVSPYLSIGKGFNHFYAQAHIGINFRTNDFSHSFRFGAEAGYKILKNLTLSGVVDIQKSFKNGNIALSTNQLSTGLFVNNQEFISTGLKVIWNIQENFGVTGSILGAASGNLVPKAASTNLGFFAKF